MFSNIPNIIPKLRHLKYFDISNNFLQQCGIQPQTLKHDDLFHKLTNLETGEIRYINILTKEVIREPHLYHGDGIKRLAYLHTFQDKTSEFYKKRKTWLSICQVSYMIHYIYFIYLNYVYYII
jgi:hypothetical protein